MNLSKQTVLYTILFWLVTHLCSGFHHSFLFVLKQILIRPSSSLTLSPSWAIFCRRWWKVGSIFRVSQIATSYENLQLHAPLSSIGTGSLLVLVTSKMVRLIFLSLVLLTTMSIWRIEWHRVCNRGCGAQSHLLGWKLKMDSPRVDDKQVSSVFVRSHVFSIGW